MSYATIVADPPWPDQGKGPPFNDIGKPREERDSRSRPVDYPTMSVDAICGLDVAALAAKDAHAYIWVINRNIPDVYVVARAWGFRPVVLLTWVKTPHAGFGMGGTYLQTTEHCLFARRGSLKATRREPSTWFNWPRTGVHSRKPEAFYDMVMQVSPPSYLELFSRSPRLGWDVWGNEVESHVQLGVA